MGLAWLQRFVLDDAFIAYRYARHAARGMGFVWNAGEPPLEGFTSFTWTLLLTIAAKLGIEPEPFSLALGVLCFGGTLVAVHSLALLVTHRVESALVCTALVALNPTAVAFATSGLETSAQTFLATATLAVLAHGQRYGQRSRGWTDRRAAIAGALAGLAVTVRMDAAVLLVVTLATIALSRARRAFVIAGASALAFVGPWLGYRLATFGRLFPNTFYAKVAGDSGGALIGLDYLATFAVTSGLLVAFVVAVGSWLRLRDRVVAPVLAFVALWCIYVAYVGADFMEFRFMTCAIPALVVLFAWVLRRELPSPAQRAPRTAFTAALVLAFLFGWRLTRGQDYFRPGLNVESVRALGNHIDDPDESWRSVGQELHRVFPRDTGVVLALRAAGVVADTTDLPVVDMFGLSDRWVAENGAIDPEAAAGHRRIAPLAYLQEREVNLVFASAMVWPRGDPRKTYSANDVRRQFLSAKDVVPPDARVLEIPLDGKRAFRCLYLTRHRAIEEKLGTEGWRIYPVR